MGLLLTAMRLGEHRIHQAIHQPNVKNQTTAADGVVNTTDDHRRLSAFSLLALMNHAQLAAFADNITSVCPVDKDGKTTLNAIQHTIMEHPHFFPYQHSDMESMAEDAECVAMCLDAAGVPKKEDGKKLSLWGRVRCFASRANDQVETPL